VSGNLRWIKPHVTSSTIAVHFQCIICGFHRLVGKSAECIYGASVIGSRAKSPYQNGQDAAKELVEANPEISCVDSYAQDQVSNQDDV
jgi:hypothetical protein